ncbi:MAG: hypothetical protein QOF45_2139 [Gaiellaceae bacterium]|jgi:hypothetical protein|nr:hypothetical protein [Gaiellaceae bacterium]
MDEFAQLKDFRLEDASPGDAREHARGVLREAVRKRRTRRRWTVVLAFAAAGVAAGAAYGIVRELIVGDPAPPEVREQPARFGHSAELIPVPHPDDPKLDQATVAAVLDSSVGRVYLFSSPNSRGGCVSTWIEGDRGYQGRLNIGSVCGGESGQSFYAFGEQEYEGKQVRLFSGRAGDGVARVALAFGERVVDVPLTGRTFLAELPNWPDGFISYAKDGTVLERRPFLRAGGLPSPTRPPHQVTKAREIASIQARNGAEGVRLFVADASDGGYCQIVRSDRTAANRGCSVPPPGATEIAVGAMNYGGAPGGILLLVGPVGSDIASLELRYQDGRRADVSLHDGWVLYEVEPRDYVTGRRPTVLLGRDANGREVASLRLPWPGPGG